MRSGPSALGCDLTRFKLAALSLARSVRPSVVKRAEAQVSPAALLLLLGRVPLRNSRQQVLGSSGKARSMTAGYQSTNQTGTIRNS
mmetsp:Transcript_10140/g.28686  ORF Transcript_10140/g.28686 Transcript_10140/m.28686 type:complete len:86 (+) Transcript_10140:72-329(+)